MLDPTLAVISVYGINLATQEHLGRPWWRRMLTLGRFLLDRRLKTGGMCVITKGGDYDIENVPEARLIRSWGGAVHAIPFAHDRSTSRLLTRIREVCS